MKYLVTLIETTVHTVEVEAKDKVRARISAEDGWCNGWLVDDNPHLIDLMVSEIIEIPVEDVA